MEKILKLSKWAKLQGISYSTAIRKYRRNEIPGVFKTDTGSIMVKMEEDKESYIIGYLRIDPGEPEENTKIKIEEFKKLCDQQKFKINETIVEKSGVIDSRRPQLIGVLDSERATQIVVLNTTDLSIFENTYINLLCKKSGCEIISLNQKVDPLKFHIKLTRAFLHFLESKLKT